MRIIFNVPFQHKYGYIRDKNNTVSHVNSIHTPCPEKGATIFLPLTLPNADHVQNYFTDRLSNKLVHHTLHVATLPCEMSALKNRHAPELSGANSHAKLSHSRQMVENIQSSMLAQFRSLTKKVFTVSTMKTSKNHQLYATAAAGRKTSRQNACTHDQRSDSH